MARKLTTTVRLDPEDAEALAKAREDGLSASDLIRKGLRIVASRYYGNRRAPSTGLFVSTDLKADFRALWERRGVKLEEAEEKRKGPRPR
jgi:Arc/MetJ-type ribon-helix-helix transcriptional regulator